MPILMVIHQRFIGQLITPLMFVDKKEQTLRNFPIPTFTIQQQGTFRIGFVSHSAHISIREAHSLLFYARPTPNNLTATMIKLLTKMEATMEAILQRQMSLVMNLKK